MIPVRTEIGLSLESVAESIPRNLTDDPWLPHTIAIQVAVVCHVIECTQIQSDLQMTKEFHLLDGHCSWLITLGGRTTTESKKPGTVNRAHDVASYASIYWVLYSPTQTCKWKLHSTSRGRKIRDRYVQRDVGQQIEKGLIGHNGTQPTYNNDRFHGRVDKHNPRRKTVCDTNTNKDSRLLMTTDTLGMATQTCTWTNTFSRRGLRVYWLDASDLRR